MQKATELNYHQKNMSNVGKAEGRISIYNSPCLINLNPGDVLKMEKPKT